VRLADEFAKQLGRRICVELAQHRERIGFAVVAYVEPQVEELLADLDRELDAPGWPARREPPGDSARGEHAGCGIRPHLTATLRGITIDRVCALTRA
jgi:hypothetical protein